MTRSTNTTSAALKLFSLLAFAVKVANGYGCYPKEKVRCCFRPNGDDLRYAVSDYCSNGLNSTAAQTYGTVIGDWCVDYVQDFSLAFYSCDQFNEPLTNWNTSSAQNMFGMFSFAASIDQPLNFDTSKVVNMGNMFSYASRFDQPLLSFVTSRVELMYGMFEFAIYFNQPFNFDTSKVTAMEYMFSNAGYFNQPVPFNTSNVVTMDHMFEKTYNFNQSLSSFNTSKVNEMSKMFARALVFNQPLPFDTSKVASFQEMFKSAIEFNQDVSAFKVGGRRRVMRGMFLDADKFSQNLSAWSGHVNTKSDVTQMFRGTACPRKRDPNLRASPQGPFCYPVLK
jgi:surface protein